ncbi:MAG: DNA polymerase III subunit gamma/tau, partial [Flavobacteriaceae bacterium]|nr:DNA polymerase III subunit gamma/tau [Flavobacteriaceae bacterium]
FNNVLSKGFEGHHFINGLASHFRDLLVAKDKVTIELLEVGDTAKKRYLEQAIKTSIPFLIQSIDKANECDLKYRTSKNQRLLVELTLMQIASITFDGEKKKPANYIIPATFFTSLSPVAKEISKKTAPIKKAQEVTQQPIVEGKSIVQKIKPPVLKNVKRRASSLSLKSVYQKKGEKKTTLEENFDNHPKDSFTEEILHKLWNTYQELLIKKGEKSMASIIATDLPIVKEGFVIQFALPNKQMQDQLKQGRSKLLKFLRESLNNYGISLEVIVNETIEKKFVYTPLEKYNKLKEKNPFIEKLKETFQLDI